MAERTFLLPDLGEGLEDATIATWLVREGETVVLNQPLVEVETAKATVEIPSPYAGRVKHLHGDTGTVIVVGNALVTFEVEGTETGPSTEPGSMGPPPTAATPKTGGGGPLGSGAVAATPAVRKLAKDLGVDLGAVEIGRAHV